MTPRPPIDELVSLFQAIIGHEGVTTGAGNIGGTSIVDAALIGFGPNTYRGFVIEIYVDDTTKVDAQVASAFNNATGEITVDTAFKGGQVPIGVKYKANIPSPALASIIADLGVPAADAVANALERDVIGNKTDTATPDDMSALATSSLMRDLKRVLLRLAPAAFTATIQGAARTDLAAMAATLATYFKAAGAAYSATVGGAARADVEASFTAVAAYFNAASAALSVVSQPGVAARTNLNDIAQDLADILAGGTGIVNFPAGAAAANGVSIAEVIRYIQETVLGYEGATALANKLTAARATFLDRLAIIAAGGAGELTAARAAALQRLIDDLTATRAGYLDNINNTDLANVIRDVAQSTGTFVFNEASALEQTAITLTIAARAKIGGIWLDFTNVTQNVTIRVKHQIDGVNYVTFETQAWVTTDEDGVLITGFTAYRNVQVSLQCGGGGAGNVNVPYAVV
jgi:hypothetical protein